MSDARPKPQPREVAEKTMNWLKRLFGSRAPKTNGSGAATDMISCDEALERLYEFLDAELDDTWQSRVEEHFEACKRCFPVMRFERSFLDAVQAAKQDAAAPEEVRNRILQALTEEGLEPRETSCRPPRRYSIRLDPSPSSPSPINPTSALVACSR